MRIRVQRSDGKAGSYLQDDRRRAEVLARRLDPKMLFVSGPIVIGMKNPFSILNPDEVCWVDAEAEAGIELHRIRPPGIESIRRLADRAEYEALLARQWPLWRKHPQGAPGDLLQALVELSMRGGSSVYLQVGGVVADLDLAREFLGVPALTADWGENGVTYVNPRCIVRARVYHSKDEVNYPSGIWFAEADDV